MIKQLENDLSRLCRDIDELERRDGVVRKNDQTKQGQGQIKQTGTKNSTLTSCTIHLVFKTRKASWCRTIMTMMVKTNWTTGGVCGYIRVPRTPTRNDYDRR